MGKVVQHTTPLSKNLASNLRYHRKKQCITQQQLADFCSVSKSAIHFVECCKTWPSSELITLISSKLGVEPIKLFEDPPTNDSVYNYLVRR